MIDEGVNELVFGFVLALGLVCAEPRIGPPVKEVEAEADAYDEADEGPEEAEEGERGMGTTPELGMINCLPRVGSGGGTQFSLYGLPWINGC